MSQEINSIPLAQPRRSKLYANYRFRAVIDWISIRIVTELPTNFDTVRTRTEVPFVEAINEGPGRAATEFVIRIQEPTSWASIESTLALFTHDHPLAAPVVVTGIEIALDAYSRANNRDELVDMVARFYKFAATIVSDNRRTSGKGKYSSEGMSTYRALLARLQAGFNIYIGNTTDPTSQHMYVKETNQKDNVTVNLKDHERRARTEITLLGEALPHIDLSDWTSHDFTNEAGYFKYRKLKDKLRPHSGVAVLNLDQIGHKRPRSCERGGTRLYSPNTLADISLNDLAYSALRELTRRMKA